MTRAKALGGEEHYHEHMGWTVDTYRLADIEDLLSMQLAVATHKGKGRIQPPKPAHRPETIKEELPEPETDLEHFDINALARRLGGN